MQGCHACCAGTGDITFKVVDEGAAGEVDGMVVCMAAIDDRIRLQPTEIARNDDAVDVIKEREAQAD